MIKVELHERVRQVRKENKLSQDEFAECLGVSRDVIKNIELNRLAKPEQKIPLMKLIAKEFNIREEWLLFGEGEKTPKNTQGNLAKFLVDIKTGKNQFAAAYVDFLASLTEDEWQVFERQSEIMRKFYETLE